MANIKFQWLTVAQSAVAAECSVATIYRWIKVGRLPAYSIGRNTTRIRPEDLKAALKPCLKEVRHPDPN